MDDDRFIALWIHGRPPGTQRAYRAAIDRLRASLAQTPLFGATLEQLQRHLTGLAGMAPRSQRLAVAAIRSLFMFHARVATLSVNPAAALTAPKAPRDLAERILTPEQVDDLVAAAPAGRARILCRLLYMSGIRAAEATGLYWRHVVPRADGQGQVTVTGKGAKTRAILLPAEFFGDLVDLKVNSKPSDPVFPSAIHAGRPLTYWELYGIVKRAAKAAGLKASPHWMRHSHASHSLDNGASLATVRDTLGHSSIAVTDAYLHARPGESSARYLGKKKD